MQRPSLLVEGSPFPKGTIPALASLLNELTQTGIRYCSWKSNEHLPEALEGRTDLDILVDPEDAEAFRRICRRHGAMPLTPPPRAAFEGMEHFLGFDRVSGRLYHLHVHDRLVLGERYVKNYRIPMEQAFLRSTYELDGVPVPRPQLELGILTARALLKYRARDVIKDVLKIRSPGIKQEIQNEIRWLLGRTSAGEVRAALAASGGHVPPEVATGFLEAYTRDLRSGADFLRLRGRLRSSLRELQRQSRARASIEYAVTMWDRRRRLRRRPAETRMQPVTGGRSIALIGADGSGKSTIAAELGSWLGWKLQVHTYYLGSKEPSRASRWSYLAFRALRRGTRTVSGSLGPAGDALSAPIAATRDVVLALHHLSIARDRTRRYLEARRDVEAGRIVIFDRFPLQSLSSTPEHRLFDGPQIASLLDGRMGLVTRALAGIEERSYRRFRLPDHLVVLHVSPGVSISRKPDHRPEVLAAKSRAADELAAIAERHGSVDVIRIDADRSLNDVLLRLKRSVWDVLA